MAFVQQTEGANTGSGTSIAATAITTTSGNRLVAFVTYFNASQQTITLSDSQGNTWNAIGSQLYDTGDDQGIQCFEATVTSAGSTTITATFGAASTFRGILVVEHSNAAGNVDNDGDYNRQSNPGTGTDAVVSTSSTNSAQPALHIGFTFDWNANAAPSSGTGFTSRTAVWSGFGAACARSEDRSLSSTGTQTATFTTASGTSIFYTASVIILESNSSVDQEGFRWGVDDGNESAHTWEAAQDTSITIAANQSRLLRLLLNATGDPASTAYALRYQKNGSGGYVAVNVGSTTDEAGTYFGGASGGTNPTTSTTITIPSSLPDDCVLSLHFTSRDHTSGTGQPTVTDNNSGASWTQRQYTTDRRAQWWWKRYEAGLSGRTITISGAVGSLSARLVVIENVYETGDPFTDFAEETNSSGDETHAAITPTYAKSAVVFAVYNYANDNAVSSVSAATTGAPGQSTGHLSTGGSDCATHVAVWNDHPASSSGSITWAQTNGTTYSHVYAVRPRTVTNEVYIAASANIAAGGEATTARLTAPSGKSTSDFVTGRRWDDENGSDSIDITTDDYTEIEWLVALSSAPSNGDYYDFRVYAGAAALTSYTETPRWTVGAPVVASVTSRQRIATNPWGPFLISRRETRSYSTNQVTVAITGQEIASAQGSVGPATAVTASGQAIASALGTLIPATVVPITGQSIASAVGTLSPTLTAPLTGQGVTVSQGNVASAHEVTLSGSTISMSLGSVSTGSDVVVSITGQSIATALGSVAPATAVGLVGSAITSALGSVSASAGGNVTVSITGQAIAALQGSLGVAHAVPIAGQSVAAALGSVIASSGVVVSITGHEITLSQGSVAAALAVPITGRTIATALGTVTGGTVVFPDGVVVIDVQLTGRYDLVINLRGWFLMTAVTRQNFTVHSGSTVRLTISVLDADGDAANLTSCTAAFYMARSKWSQTSAVTSEGVSANCTVSISSPSTGVVVVTLPASTTEPLQDDYQWELWITDASDNEVLAAYGTALFVRNIG